MVNLNVDEPLGCSANNPNTVFYCLIDGARPPQRADRSAAGTLPTRATRHCDAVTSASAFGWYVFAPVNFQLLWDGDDEVFWKWGDQTKWQPLSSAQCPGLGAVFDASAPNSIKGFSPPFLTKLPEPGVIQIWSGLFARTAPGWSLLIRSPANLPQRSGCSLYEGIVETDAWFGPLFTNLRLTRTQMPIRFTEELPLFQVQPLPRVAYDDRTLEAVSFVNLPENLDPRDWDDYLRTIVLPNCDPNRRQGAYAIAARKRRRRNRCDLAAIG